MNTFQKQKPFMKVTNSIQNKPGGVKNMLDKLKVSNFELVDKLEERKYSSRGDGSGCENTMFSDTWDSWSDNDPQ